MASVYGKTSAYYETAQFGIFLDVLNFRPIPRSSKDVEFTINAIYHQRPDLLAHDLYKRSQLWWVFAVRNPNSIKDPIYDFVKGRTIFIPNIDSIHAALGI